jgi:hypothetical protein
MTWRTTLSCSGLFLLAACGPSTSIEVESSARGAALAGSLEVTVRDEASGTTVVGAVVRARSLTTGESITEASTDASGVARLASASLAGSITVEVASPTSVQIFLGVRHDTLVVALPGAAPPVARVAGNARALPSGAATVTVGAASDVTLLRTASLDAAATAPCTTRDDGCTFELLGHVEPGSLAAATVSDATNAVLGFVVGRVGPSGGTIETSVAAEDFVMTLPAASGLTGIVGVPGIAEDGALVLLPQVQSSVATLRVPARMGELAGASYWVIVEGHPFTGAATADPNARSVLFARGVTTAAELPAWGSWLVAPTAAIDVDTAVTFDAVPEADVHAVDWIDASGRVRASAWLLDDTLLGVDALLPSGLASRDVAEVRVRALDTTSPPGSEGFVAGAIDRGVIRFSERILRR